MDWIYLDYNGSTPVHPEVVKAMALALAPEASGNAAASHPDGLRARERIEGARAVVAEGIGARPEEILFTSGGTESNNHALLGTARARPERRHVVVSAIEHWSVRRTAEWMGSNGWRVTLLPADRAGAVAPSAVADAIDDDTAIVSVMLANNVTGVLQPVREIGEICRQRGVPFHTDAVAALGKVPIRVDEIGCDLLSLSAHKMYAPKGCGVLWIRPWAEPTPLIHGCGQQDGRRSGTENTPGVVALARAFELLARGELPSAQQLEALRERLAAGIREVFPDARRNGTGAMLPNTLNVTFPGVDGAALVRALGRRGVSVSAGAASNKATPSHVLIAMGLSDAEARSSLRFSLGSGTTEDALDRAVGHLAEALAQVSSESASEAAR